MSGYSKKRKTMKVHKENLRTYNALSYVTGSAAYFSGIRVAMNYPAVDNTVTGGRVTNEGSPCIAVLNQIPSTDNTGNARSGRSTVMKSVALKGIISFGATADSSVGNLYLVYDRDAVIGATTLGAADVGLILDQAYLFNTTPPGCAQSNINYTSRFKIIKHWQIGHHADASCLAVPFNEFVSLKDKEALWKSDNSTGNWNAMSRGALYLVGSGTGSAGTTGITFTGTSRLYFQEC